MAGKLSRLNFQREAEDIISQWTVMSDALRRGSESKNSFFKREVYRLLKRYIDARCDAVFMEAIKRSPRRRPLAAILDQPFKLGLYAMFDDDSLSRNDRKVWGEQMEYAWRNGIDADMLIGFIYMSGSPAAIVEKLRTERERAQRDRHAIIQPC